MKGIIEWIKFKIFRISPKCRHQNKKVRRWVIDNTPMIELVCKDCGSCIDFGHVYGSTKDWDSNGWIDVH